MKNKLMSFFYRRRIKMLKDTVLPYSILEVSYGKIYPVILVGDDGLTLMASMNIMGMEIQKELTAEWWYLAKKVKRVINPSDQVEKEMQEASK